MRVLVKGAGVAGLAAAHELMARGADVTVFDPRRSTSSTASWYAGGMLAPYCERESAEERVLDLGLKAASWWEAALPGSVVRNGTLVLVPARDVRELDRFGSRTSGFADVNEQELSNLEPDLEGRFRRGLFFKDEAHLDPRHALTALTAKLAALGVQFESERDDGNFDRIVDCTGYSPTRPGLRGVRGEMLILQTRDISLARPVRLIHPRFPVYIVPRADHIFMVGATMIESDATGPITTRSMMELLNAAYSLHPAFGEAAIIETGVGVRPAYADNFPRVGRHGKVISINGLYRHGFLLAPAMAIQAAAMVFDYEKAT
ncbi:glycine oxidase ThiO [Phyllobacterium myrsinacearum]|uniref:D-amino-acid oxidase n=1 Tax=Phyllobacterium myrsinacearum TaxID=28101 RepID=A0A839EQ90_9HYPH|nr:glycine oxidase ThiO [Phyllobacterium myrsinacearum]MBA8878637.1 glycine oxidase [Phyllobacterium myrsinacearum]